MELLAVLPEICYLIASRLGHKAMRHFVSSLTTKAIRVEPLTDGNTRGTTRKPAVLCQTRLSGWCD
jgi:hypothetical protein